MKFSFILSLLIFVFSLPGFSQKQIVASQYMHNQYSINPAFAGSREVMTVFAGYRKQWTGLPRSPHLQYFTAHTPLKNENIAFGLSFYNEQFPVVRNSGFSATYAYRVKLNDDSRLAFGISGGFVFSNIKWSNIDLIDPNDPSFGNNETETDPQLGFGIAWYKDRFFAGFSISDMFYKNPFNKESPFFEPKKTDYLITAGYLYDINQNVSLQPSALLKFNPDNTSLLDISGTVILRQFISAGITYRSNNEIIAMVSWLVSPQLRISYSYDYPTGNLSNLNSGSHELSLQFDFGYKISTVSPKFF